MKVVVLMSKLFPMQQKSPGKLQGGTKQLCCEGFLWQKQVD